MRRFFPPGLIALALAAAISPLAAGHADAAGSSNRAIEKRLLKHIEALASDEFEGREPGTPGEAKTLQYLGKEWFDIGLVSGTNDPGNEWFAPVTLVARTPEASTAQFTRGGKPVALPAGEILMLTSGKRSLVRNAPLFFVGRAEGKQFARNELAGRIAVMLDSGMTNRMRQDELLAAGALAVLTVLDGERTLQEVEARRKRSGYALANDTLGGDLEGFITRSGMETLLKRSRYTMARLERYAAQDKFVPRMLDLRASLEATTTESIIQTFNLIGKLPGRKPDDGAVLFVSHWDHFGICGEAGAEDRICNGAVDNASGVAAVTEIARQLAKGPRPDRDTYFLATTAEELGLLGAHAFAENPPIPLPRFVAAFNIDTIALAPRGTPLAVVGKGMTGLEDGIAQVARKQKRRLVAGEEADEFVRRQDGWALLQHDIPAVMVTSAYGDMDRLRNFFDTHYHRPDDDLSRGIELGGAAEDVTFHVALAQWFGSTRDFPLTDQ